MVKRDANIDLLFRNGLKDMEVLPPADVWDNISPSLRLSRDSGWIFRIAAGVAAMVSLGLLSYYVGMRSSENLLQPVVSEQVEFTDDVAVPENNSLPVSSASTQAISTDGISDATLAFVPVSDNMLSPFLTPVNNLTDNTEETISPFDVDRSTLRYEENTPEKLKYITNNELLSGDAYGINLVPQDLAKIEKWKVGARVSPTYLSSSLKAANQSMNGSLDESALLSYTGGVTVSFKVTSRFSLQTGLYYSSLGRQISGIESYSGFSPVAGTKSGSLFGVATGTGTISSSNRNIFLVDVLSTRITSQYTVDNFDPVKADLTPFGNELKQNFEYLEIPFMLSYKIIDKKVDFNVLGGLSYNFLLGNSTYAIGEGTSVLIGTTEGVDPILLSSALGMSLEYALSQRLSFNFEPTFRYFLNSEGRISLDNPYTFGLFSGLYFNF